MNSPHSMDKATFMGLYGDIFEHSPWIAGQVWEQGLGEGSIEELYAAFSETIRNADRQQQMALLCAHPQLACGIASAGDLTAASRKEQRGAGLDQCSTEEYEEFERLNRSYTDKFGFPFIMAVKGFGRKQILENFRARLQNSAEQEFHQALEQVIRIGGLRLKETNHLNEMGT